MQLPASSSWFAEAGLVRLARSLFDLRLYVENSDKQSLPTQYSTYAVIELVPARAMYCLPPTM